jgi:molybdenum cofactor cytidylyltransferase
MPATPKIALLLLAAGGSSRMGRPKQLLTYQGQSLLRRAAETALATPCRPIIAVLGAAADQSRAELTDLTLHTSENSNWPSGMGSSIKLGLRRALELEPDSDAILITLCDQPLITPADLARLIDAHRTSPHAIVATRYPNSPGVPALFPRPTFPDLLALNDAAGAKSLLLSAGNSLLQIEILAALTDVDTPSDYARLTPPQPPTPR